MLQPPGLATSWAGGCPRAVVTARRRRGRVPEGMHACAALLPIGMCAELPTACLASWTPRTPSHRGHGREILALLQVVRVCEWRVGSWTQHTGRSIYVLLDPNSALVFFNLHRARLHSIRFDCANFFTIHEKDPHEFIVKKRVNWQ